MYSSFSSLYNFINCTLCRFSSLKKCEFKTWTVSARPFRRKGKYYILHSCGIGGGGSTFFYISEYVDHDWNSGRNLDFLLYIYIISLIRSSTYSYLIKKKHILRVQIILFDSSISSSYVNALFIVHMKEFVHVVKGNTVIRYFIFNIYKIKGGKKKEEKKMKQTACKTQLLNFNHN